jgi:hypothetical protein
VTITIIKMLIAIPLSIAAIGAFWLLWTIIKGVFRIIESICDRVAGRDQRRD